ncbi:MAG TPA: 3-keto-5-aminohexanoate cleavage protein [Solirubrobacteraceae bacterium]|jgi:3-keto-5-aminohexanoate cleavage enzyme|nr:3-keto-5-aminohexanoate cleavage protein [Solirubrobacteraceae bacterium]
MSDPAILTCAVAGGVVTGNPNQPATREQVIDAAVGAAEAGASVVHIHARTTDGEMTQDPEDYRAIKQAVRERTDDVVLNFTTGGKLGSPAQERRRSLLAGPELASLNCGSVNFGPDDVVFMNPNSLIDELAAEMAERGIVPEYECFDIGMAVKAARMAQAARGPAGMMHMVLGVIGGAPASIASIELFAGLVPVDVPWMVTAIGRHNFPMMAVTLALGGHIRTGLEDVVYVAPGEYAASNAQLVTRARALCDAIGRPVASPAQAREILGIG